MFSTSNQSESSSKLNCFEAGDTLQRAESCAFSTRMRRSIFPLSSTPGHMPCHSRTYGPMISKASLTHPPALSLSINSSCTIRLPSSPTNRSLSCLSFTTACMTASSICDGIDKSNSSISIPWSPNPSVSSTATAARNSTSSLTTSPSHPLHHACTPNPPSGHPHHITCSDWLFQSGPPPPDICARYSVSSPYISNIPCATNIPNLSDPSVCQGVTSAMRDGGEVSGVKWSSQKRACDSE
ncbi:hypothetical protein ASPFODRAFT_681478 [Aspergillus luchuensis CBS 106.47]|uniref:Uncharacterized protein n=1 Tax=Aspergillus luchuensis (strain CBS 106.47) TaxID=1137211 RepID=A0A1M3TCJ1_ASPLC|nr:hypothetical protein ASPFODRAFT_681478 [Aspergillus luchuensis CBS 106.47]